MTLQERDGQSGGQDTNCPTSRNATSIAELTCTDVRAQLNDLLDGTLPSPERVRLMRHLAQCADCQALEHTLEQTIHGLHDLGPVPPPGGMRDRLRERLKQQPPA